MTHVESAGLTDVGRKRKENEDAFFIDDRTGLYVVSDGMGGHLAGEVASRLVVAAVRDVITGQRRMPREDENADSALSGSANLLLYAIRIANEEVFSAASGNESFKGMGATLSAVLLSGETLVAANVGDSPIYLVHKGVMERLSIPHTLAAEHAALDPEGKTPLDPKFRHVLTRAVGTHETVLADACEIQRCSGDILVICSDGLSNTVTPDEICRRVREEAPAAACRQLVELANQRGGEDNITVIVIKSTPERSRIRHFVKRFTHFFWRNQAIQ
ncbi:MAG: protein phosphatase 2C domain-containing protein [Pseudomonadota bacterium]